MSWATIRCRHPRDRCIRLPAAGDQPPRAISPTATASLISADALRSCLRRSRRWCRPPLFALRSTTAAQTTAALQTDPPAASRGGHPQSVNVVSGLEPDGHPRACCGLPARRLETASRSNYGTYSLDRPIWSDLDLLSKVRLSLSCDFSRRWKVNEVFTNRFRARRVRRAHSTGCQPAAQAWRGTMRRWILCAVLCQLLLLASAVPPFSTSLEAAQSPSGAVIRGRVVDPTQRCDRGRSSHGHVRASGCADSHCDQSAG